RLCTNRLSATDAGRARESYTNLYRTKDIFAVGWIHAQDQPRSACNHPRRGSTDWGWTLSESIVVLLSVRIRCCLLRELRWSRRNPYRAWFRFLGARSSLRAQVIESQTP